MAMCHAQKVCDTAETQRTYSRAGTLSVGLVLLAADAQTSVWCREPRVTKTSVALPVRCVKPVGKVRFAPYHPACAQEAVARSRRGAISRAARRQLTRYLRSRRSHAAVCGGRTSTGPCFLEAPEGGDACH
eukprot:scaffold38852_cov76-Phaeocystis_antarctica.AAC.1